MEKTFNKDSNKQVATIIQKQFVYNYDNLNVLCCLNPLISLEFFTIIYFWNPHGKILIIHTSINSADQ